MQDFAGNSSESNILATPSFVFNILQESMGRGGALKLRYNSDTVDRRGPV
jgi:hypothetical protein